MKQRFATSRSVHFFLITVLLFSGMASSHAADPAPKAQRPPAVDAPPADLKIKTAKLKTFTPAAADVLKVPEGVTGDFDVAKTPPAIRFAILPGQWKGASLWSSWGDALFASDTNFYCSIGDHNGPHGYSYVFKVDPKSGTVDMIVDVDAVLKTPAKDYAPGKIHAPLMEFDGWLVFAGYRGKTSAVSDEYNYVGDHLVRWNLTSGEAAFDPPPAPYCSLAASVVHKPSKRIYGVGPGGKRLDGKSKFFVYDLVNKKTLYCGDPSPDATRAIIVAEDGRVWYSAGAQAAKKGKDGKADTPASPSLFARYNPKSNKAEMTRLAVPGDKLRAASRTNSDGIAFGITWDGIMFRFDTRKEKTTVIGRTFETGPSYTAVCKLSPDERFLYYVPGAHGGTHTAGTPIIQFDTKTNRRKVIAFIHDYMRGAANYYTGGTFGLDISPDGKTLGIIFNGRELSDTRSATGSNEFDNCMVLLIDIPESER